MFNAGKTMASGTPPQSTLSSDAASLSSNYPSVSFSLAAVSTGDAVTVKSCFLFHMNFVLFYSLVFLTDLLDLMKCFALFAHLKMYM